MSWHYQIVRTKRNVEGKTYIKYAIHEVFHIKGGKNPSYTADAIPAECWLEKDTTPTEKDCVKSIIKQLQWMLKDAKKYPVLNGAKNDTRKA